ncbi:tetratricopeptide repeat protein 33-like [Neltuma alba]|uniref:tetratricopeptide repeat protein 33 n=1 Tax=Neltuma alba TaxID=207710 RepID=UPI0010A3A92B|nr:tetratricopeptide repeat protein 33-like [Prosopis alba]XP_028757659.1 tetratricopeptide repeat protein 33-like [Prosopis alba]XP_028757692.1 tetratricopeptide repeat protein 33-like [Prosopis alba]
MKVTWKNSKKRSLPAVSNFSNLPFEHQEEDVTPHQDHARLRGNKDAETGARNSDQSEDRDSPHHSDLSEARRLAKEFQAQGDKLAEDGKYGEALGKWESALSLTPDVAVLHEQKAQVLLEIGDAWNALKAAIRATELQPSWAEAWVTLGRAQLNFGEPDCAIESFDRALSIKPDCVDAQGDRKTASHLVKKRKQLHSAGLSSTKNRYEVGDKESA